MNLPVYKCLFVSLVLLLCSSFIQAQTSLEQLNSYMAEVKAGSYKPVPHAILQDEANAAPILAALVGYQKDSSVSIRSKAYNISKRIGQEHEASNIRQQAINQQIKALDDADAGIMIKAINALTGFKNTDFTNNQQLRIINRLKADMLHLEPYARLVGYMPKEAALAPLQQVLAQTTNGWARFNIQLALARRGDVAATEAIVNKMNTATIDDGFVYDVVPELVYSRSMEVFKFLEKIIFSEEANCSSSNPDSNTKILCGYRVMEYLAPAIVDYPLATDAYGELLTNDYEQALLDLRAWLTVNPIYALELDTY